MGFPLGAVPGIDVSHWQTVVDWETVAAGGEHFAFAKASEGADISDQYFADNWQFDQSRLSGVPSEVANLDASNGTLADLQNLTG